MLTALQLRAPNEHSAAYSPGIPRPAHAGAYTLLDDQPPAVMPISPLSASNVPFGVAVPAFTGSEFAILAHARDCDHQRGLTIRRLAEIEEQLRTCRSTASSAALHQVLVEADLVASQFETAARHQVYRLANALFETLGIKPGDMLTVTTLEFESDDSKVNALPVHLRFELYEVVPTPPTGVFLALVGCVLDETGQPHRNVEARALLRPGSFVLKHV